MLLNSVANEGRRSGAVHPGISPSFHYSVFLDPGPRGEAGGAQGPGYSRSMQADYRHATQTGDVARHHSLFLQRFLRNICVDIEVGFTKKKIQHSQIKYIRTVNNF